MRQIGIHSLNDQVRLSYLIGFLNQHPLSRAASLAFYHNPPREKHAFNIWYGAQAPQADFDLWIPAQELFFQSSSASDSLFPNVFDYQGQTIYSVENKRGVDIQVMVHDRRLQFDLLEAIFFHISRYEEVFCRPKAQDISGRLHEDQHFLVYHQLEKQPVVDQLVAALLGLIAGPSRPVATTYDLTHDIDFLFRYPSPTALLRALAGSLYRGRGWDALRQHIRTYLAIRQGKTKDPFDCFDWLLSGDAQWTQKTLYLMAGGETVYDNHYNIGHPRIKSIVAQARQAGYAIGLHPSYNAAVKKGLFLAEKEKLEAILGEKVTRSRQHWLRFDWAITPTLLNEAGIQEDASLGYRRRLGFRCGTGFPYHPYDFVRERAFDWLERPPACMDSAVLHEASHSGIDVSALLLSFFQQNTLQTHLSINFHNSNFDPSLVSGPPLEAFYREVILQLPW